MNPALHIPISPQWLQSALEVTSSDKGILTADSSRKQDESCLRCLVKHIKLCIYESFVIKVVVKFA